MKKRVVAACLAAVLGIAPCSVGASQESEVQCISETESSDILLETCTQEFQETKPEVSEETLQEIETVKQETQSESETTAEQEIQSEPEVTAEQETEAESEATTEQETSTESKTQSADGEKSSEEIQTEPQTEYQTEYQKQTQESILARKNMVNASPEGEGTYFNEYDENDLFWANQNGQGEVAISQVQLLRSMLA